MTNFSLKRPWLITVVTLLMTGYFGWHMQDVHFDNDPENMLAQDEPVRKFHHEIKDKYALYDFVIVGIVNEDHENGVFNVETLGRVDQLTRELLRLERSDEGFPLITDFESGAATGQTAVDLRPTSMWKRMLNLAFRHNPNRLFDDEGQAAIIGRELIAPSVVDNIEQAELGSLKLEYLMEHPPKTEAEALAIREDAMNNPLYKGTLVSEDGAALILFLPIADKTFSYNVANLVSHLTEDWPAADQVHITGLPVAEDTFGVEMLIQMATSAPMAGLAIFLLLMLFFKRLSLIVAPMIVAVVSIVATMGLLIGLGFDVHIMSSMIAIFLMPIAVADSVHILSEFYDTYHRFKNKAETVRYVVGHLFMPMLFTSLTTMVGFGSLATTPIPPVQVFGLHVAFGVGLAWLLTMTFIPAYIMLFVRSSSLASLASDYETDRAPRGALNRVLASLGGLGFQRAKTIVGLTILVLALSVMGITKIRVNDNPVKWFTSDHPVRVADRVLNRHFGGTYTAYLTFESAVTTADAQQANGALTEALAGDWQNARPEDTAAFKQAFNAIDATDADAFFSAARDAAKPLDDTWYTGWDNLAYALLDLDPATADRATVLATIAQANDVPSAYREQLRTALGELAGPNPVETALAYTDKQLALTFATAVDQVATQLTAPAFKQPAMLRYIEDLQEHLATITVVGKTTSAVDALKKAAYELQFQPDTDPATNQANFSVPDTVPAVAQVFTQLESMKKKDSLFHMVTRDYDGANLWVQLTSGDNRDMETVVGAVESFLEQNPPPLAVDHGWAGLTYINVVWQDKMVRGMLTALVSSFVFVLIMMMILFRSPLFGILAMVPLSVTITLIYGLIGWVGKDYDMPVAVLSSLTLGLSVDFAIHFLQRSREMVKQTGCWRDAAREMFKEPAMAISRNAITISIGFTPLLIAPLVPYRTVGFFLATIMAVSWVATLFILPALMTLMRRWLFQESSNTQNATEVTHA